MLPTLHLLPCHLIGNAMQMGARILLQSSAIVMQLVDHSVGITAAAQLTVTGAATGQAPCEVRAARILSRAGQSYIWPAEDSKRRLPC